MPPVPKSLADAAEKEVVDVIRIFFAVWMHDLAYDFVVEECRGPDAGYRGEVGDVRLAEGVRRGRHFLWWEGGDDLGVGW